MTRFLPLATGEKIDCKENYHGLIGAFTVIVLSGKTQYLRFCGEPGKRRINISNTQRLTPESNAAYCRISPIFPAETTDTRTDFDFRGEWSVVFFGPLAPDMASDYIGKSGRYWMTLGLLNNLIVCRPSRRLEQLEALCRRKGVPIEHFIVYDGIIKHSKIFHFPSGPGLSIPSTVNEEGYPEITYSLSELRPLLFTISTRSLAIRPDLKPAIEDYIHQINKIVEAALPSASPQSRTLERKRRQKKKKKSVGDGYTDYFNGVGDLQKINSGLARFAAQMCVGIPPLLSHECHYWAHSALGIGTPILGLYALVSHINDAIGAKLIPQRFGALLDRHFPAGTTDIEKDSHEVDINTVAPKLLPDEVSRPALSLPFFSGRDGFQTNAYSISVPVTSLTAANNIRWSLTHVTHELSHDIIGAILGRYLVPSRRDDRWREEIRDILDGQASDNYGRYIKRKFYIATQGFAIKDESEDIGDNGSIDVERTSEIGELVDRIDQTLEDSRPEIEEVMVHAFDFLYFHNSDTDKFIKAVWSCWATIPEVERRVAKYIERTICAVSLHPDASKNENYAYTRLASTLGEFCKLPAVAPCCEYALDYLRRNRRAIMRACVLQWPMADLVRRFLFSEDFLRELHGEERRGGDFHVNRLDDAVMTNPLAFANRYCSSPEKVSPAQTAWLFTCLAHSCERRSHVT